MTRFKYLDVKYDKYKQITFTYTDFIYLAG
jgi:hypothetical protein